MTQTVRTGTGTTDQVFAPAKLTVNLAVTGVRDDGYHLIDAEMVTLDFGDTLHISPLQGEVAGAAESPISLSWPEAQAGTGNSADSADSPDGVAPIPLDADNLVARALRLAGRIASVHIDKRIPPGAGLGGGSADAAAVLRWAGYTDLDAAGSLGADIPFCMIGGRARVRGIGELIDPLPFESTDFTLLTPPFGCSTPAVYRVWDELGGPTGENGNDLEPAALIVEPRMAEWRDRLGDATGLQPRLAGSGSTWFVFGHHEVPDARHATTAIVGA